MDLVDVHVSTICVKPSRASGVAPSNPSCWRTNAIERWVLKRACECMVGAVDTNAVTASPSTPSAVLFGAVDEASGEPPDPASDGSPLPSSFARFGSGCSSFSGEWLRLGDTMMGERNPSASRLWAQKTRLASACRVEMLSPKSRTSPASPYLHPKRTGANMMCYRVAMAAIGDTEALHA